MKFTQRSARLFGALLVVTGLGGLATAKAALTNLNIRLVSSVKPSANPLAYGDVWAETNLACLGVWTGYSTYNYGVGIYSISNLAAPVLRSIYSPSPTSQNQFELGAVRNQIGYFGSWSGGGLHIVSLTNSSNPMLLCRVGATTGNVTNGFDRVHTLWLERDYMYEAAHVAGIVSVKVFNVSNPATPVYLQDIVTTNTTKVHQIMVRNRGASTILYTSGWGGANDGNLNSPGQTDIWDVSQVGSQPAQWLGRVYSGYNSHSSYPTPDGNTLVVCRETPGGDVRLYDISNPATITSNAVPLVTLTPASMGMEGDIPHNPVVVSNFLFLSWYQNGLQIFDITDRTRPVRVGFYDTYPAPQDSSYQGNWGIFPYLGFDRLLVSDIQSGLMVMDATAVLTPTNNYPPLILTQPVSQTIAQGVTAAFAPVVTGSSLRYQWQFNGANLAGATNQTLTLPNVQAAQAGSYTFVVSNATASITSTIASLSVIFPQTFQTVFYEDFDSVSASNNWNLFAGSANAISDYTVAWAYDYSGYYSVYNGLTIPPAPNSTNGTTRGLRLTVNNNDLTQAAAGVSLYPKNQNFSGTYRLKFDLWINYPGGPAGAGSTGSTEHFTCGLNHTGTRVNWDSATVNPSDGVWFAMDGEGGTSTDYRAYAGSSQGSPTLLSFASSGFSVSGATSRDSADTAWQALFPSPAYESAGAPGKRWVQVELNQDVNNVLTWRMNNNLIAQRPNTAFTNGTIMIGYMDLFTSIASPAADAFVLFDNVRVEAAVPATAPAITAQPQNVSVYPGEDAAFSVAATGSAPMSFQWRFDGVNIPGATSNSYARAHADVEHVGAYSVVVSNAAGSVTSSNGWLTLIDSPYISAVQATPGERSALISWQTTVPANSQVQYEAASVVLPGPQAMSAAAEGGFSSGSYIDPALTTDHVVLLTGLSPQTRYSYQVISIADTNTFVSGVYQFATAGTIILDNPSATFTGAWTISNTSTDKFGVNYAYAATTTGPPTATVTYRPTITTPGKYDVLAWYPHGGNQADNAPYTIANNGGVATITVNQQAGGGGWQLLAAGLDFAKGTNGYVRLANNCDSSFIVADAIRFEYVEAQDFPSSPTIPAWWQDFYFGGPTDPATDPDGDGYTTAQEYVMGTSPTNRSSRLSFAHAVKTNTVKLTFWPYLGNRSYELLSRADLGTPVWQTAATNPSGPAPDGQGIFTLATTNTPKNFYRLKVRLVTNNAFAGRLKIPDGKSYPAFASDPVCGPNRAYVLPARP